jgi:DME family drug/metabolite transporter
MRLAMGGAALLLWAVARGAFQARPGAGRWPVGATLLAAACMAGYQLCFFAAVNRTGVAVGTVVAIGSAPALAGLLGWLVRREAPGWAWAGATALSVTGCVLLGISGGSGVAVDVWGVLLALGAGGTYALYVLANKGLVTTQRPEAVTGVVFATGALLLLPVYFTQDFAWLASLRGSAVALHLGVVATALAYALFAEALTTTPIATAVTLTLVEPLTATLLGVLLLGERLTPGAAVGVGLLFAGLVVLAWATQRARPARRTVGAA